VPEKSHGKRLKVPFDSIRKAHAWLPDGGLASGVQNCGGERAVGCMLLWLGMPKWKTWLKGLGLCAHSGGIMLGGLLFAVCVILQFHYHDPIPWYIWVLALIAQLVSFGEPAMRSAIKSKKD
jgi:hypothetical protein